MPSGENVPNPNEGKSPETSRIVDRERAEKATSAELDARKKELSQELNKLEQERAAAMAIIQSVEGGLGNGSINSASESSSESSVETSELSPESAANLAKAKSKVNFKKTIALVALAGSIVIGGFVASRLSSEPIVEPINPTSEQLQDDSEKDQLRLSYDYTHWADFENKSSKNAYDYDYSDCFNDVEKTKTDWYEVAERTPEALSSYVYYAFTEDEKADLGIANMSPTEIDDLMSDPENPEAGAMQKKLLSALKNFINNDAEFDYYYENDTEHSHYIYFVDENGDNVMTPDEMHLGYSTVKRNGAAQVDVYRTVDGKRVKVLDLNLYCGFQPNFEIPPVDIPFIPDEEEPIAEPISDPIPTSDPIPVSDPEPIITPTPSYIPPAPIPNFGTLTPKSAEEQNKYAGDNVDVQSLDDIITPKSTLDEDQANFKSIEEQKQKDAERAVEAEKVRAEQAEAERRVAEEAEARRQAEAAAMAGFNAVATEADRQAVIENQAAADEAAAAAAAAAAEQQAAAAAAEQQATAAAATAAAAQAAADAQASANAAAATANANAGVGERANIYNGGNF